MGYGAQSERVGEIGQKGKKRKKLMYISNSVVAAGGRQGGRYWRRVWGINCDGRKLDLGLTWGGEHIMHCTNNVL